MSYNTIHAIANDQALQNRIVACVADEGSANPYGDLTALMWPVATADDVVAAYASAIAADNPDPGGDESVITDAMILGIVQANTPAP